MNTQYAKPHNVTPPTAPTVTPSRKCSCSESVRESAPIGLDASLPRYGGESKRLTLSVACSKPAWQGPLQMGQCTYSPLARICRAVLDARIEASRAMRSSLFWASCAMRTRPEGIGDCGPELHRLWDRWSRVGFPYPASCSRCVSLSTPPQSLKAPVPDCFAVVIKPIRAERLAHTGDKTASEKNPGFGASREPGKPCRERVDSATLTCDAVGGVGAQETITAASRISSAAAQHRTPNPIAWW